MSSDKSGVRLWLPLDRHLGPARRISRLRAASMADDVVAAASVRRPKVPGARGRRTASRNSSDRSAWRKVLLVTAASFALPLAAAGAVYFALERESTPPPASARGHAPLAIHPAQRP
jgi:anti-sigma-K factor RskA